MIDGLATNLYHRVKTKSFANFIMAVNTNDIENTGSD